MLKTSSRGLWFWMPVIGSAAVVVTLVIIALRPRPVLVDLASVARLPLSVTVDEEGRSRVRDVYTVSAPIPGRVLRTPVSVGDAVERNRTTLAVIEETIPALLDARARREIEAQIAAANAGVDLAAAELQVAITELAFARSELERAQTLSRSNTIASRTLEKARVDAEMKNAQVARSRAGLESRRRELDAVRAKLLGPPLNPAEAVRDDSACCVSILAPVSGRVLKRLHESEKVVPAGTPLLEIGDVADIEIVADLLSTDAVKVREGAAATIDGWGGPQPLSAKVRRVEPAGFTKVSALGIEEQRVKIILDVVTPHSARSTLGHDYRVMVKIHVWSSPDALVIPLSAIFRREERWAVFVLMGGKAHSRLIEVGHRNNDQVEILSGLTVGEGVILHPSDKIGEGVRVSPRASTTTVTASTIGSKAQSK